MCKCAYYSLLAGILQYTVPEAKNADYHSRSEGENSVCNKNFGKCLNGQVKPASLISLHKNSNKKKTATEARDGQIYMN